MTDNDLTDRERALIEGLTTESRLTFCPYESLNRYKNDSEHPNICVAGCWASTSTPTCIVLLSSPKRGIGSTTASLGRHHPLRDWALEHEGDG